MPETFFILPLWSVDSGNFKAVMTTCLKELSLALTSLHHPRDSNVITSSSVVPCLTIYRHSSNWAKRVLQTKHKSHWRRVNMHPWLIRLWNVPFLACHWGCNVIASASSPCGIFKMGKYVGKFHVWLVRLTTSRQHSKLKGPSNVLFVQRGPSVTNDAFCIFLWYVSQGVPGSFSTKALAGCLPSTVILMSLFKVNERTWLDKRKQLAMAMTPKNAQNF